MSTSHLTAEQVISGLDRCRKNEEEETCMYCAGCPASVQGGDCQTHLFKEAKRLLRSSAKTDTTVKVRGSFIKGENYCQCGFQLMGRPDFQPKFCHQCGRRLNWYEVTDYEEGKTWWEDKWEKERNADDLSIKNHHLALDKLALLDEVKELKEANESLQKINDLLRGDAEPLNISRRVLTEAISSIKDLKVPLETLHSWRNVHNDALDKAIQLLSDKIK